ncbi:hypothetical protein FRB96_007802 [Tulasnella sp. 330]|nr:hypothetical protein FRB96_007802 [Tulasnella sp. 330]KAG8872659.1 hypothetical protein FRB97_007438 [Tulasnella sp. 331]KAG8885753.1 hypothetical protein FRB98_001617 [Tulasnella sp. 332]
MTLSESTTAFIHITPPPPLDPIPLSPITLWQSGAVNSVHSFPGVLPPEKLQKALEKVIKLWPVVAGRFVRHQNGEGEWEYFIEHTATPLVLQHTTTSSLPTPLFPVPAVIQPALSPYIISLDASAQLNNPSSPLLSIHLTTSPTTSVLAICWAHILGDDAAFNAFEKALSDLCEGKVVEGPALKGHVKLRKVSEEVVKKWEIPQLGNMLEIKAAYSVYGDAHVRSKLVQVVFAPSEVKLLKSLSRVKEAMSGC